MHVDTLLYPGYAVPPYDDSLLAKIIIRAETWNVALARLHHALNQFEVKGIVQPSACVSNSLDWMMCRRRGVMPDF